MMKKNIENLGPKDIAKDDEEKYDWTNVQFRNALFCYNELTRDNIEYIKKLPHSISTEFGGIKVLLAHGSPNSVTEFIHENNDEVMEKYTKDMKEDILIIGHTHDKMWSRYYNNKLIINAGCAGVSPYYKSKAEYVILEIENLGLSKVDFKLIDYDLDLVKQKIIDSGILEKDKVLMNLTFLAINGFGEIRENFFREAKNMMLERHGVWHKNNAKGIYTYFKLFDDDIWLGLAEKYKDYFVF